MQPAEHFRHPYPSQNTVLPMKRRIAYETNKGASNDNRGIVLRTPANDEADEQQDITKDDEPAAPEEI